MIPEGRAEPRVASPGLAEDSLPAGGERTQAEGLFALHQGRLHRVDVVLAPLAGITDAVFRRICLEYGADMVVSEMISAEGLLRDPAHLRAVRSLDTGEGPLALQVFGSAPWAIGEASSFLSALGPGFVDINLGCPTRKVVEKSGGAALLRDLKLLGRICRAAVLRSFVPVSAKIRAGWDGFTGAGVCGIARVVEDSGVSVVTVHARTGAQGFSGSANWRLIAAVKRAVSIPVIGNGDVRTASDFFKMKSETGCDAVMIGRAAIGNPWIFSEIKSRLAGREFSRPSHRDRIELLLSHVRGSVEKLGEPLGLVASRKVMAAYVKCLPNSRRLRQELMACRGLVELEGVVETYLRENGFS